MIWLDRTLSTVLSRAAVTFPALVVTGPRQSGKTSLIRRHFGSTHNYLSLENPDVRERATADPRGFLARHHGPAIFDEIQFAPVLLNYLKSLIDEDRTPGRWVLTGSQQFTLMAHVSQSLAGRAAIVTLLPLSIAEAAGRPEADMEVERMIRRVFAPDTSRLLSGSPPCPRADWILRGGYPEMRTNPKVDRRLWFASYIQTYLERDVRQLANVGDLDTFARFVRLCAARTAQVLNMSDLARDTGVSVPTVKRWLSALQAGGQVFLLPPYHRNFGKRLIKAPKLYFTDTGVAAFLLGLHNAEAVLDGNFAGPLFETAVVIEWLKVFLHRGELPALYYWRTSDGIEVDLIVEHGGRLHPIEIKSTSTVRPRDAAGLLKWLSLVGKESADGIIVADIAEDIPVAKGVRAVPWWWS